MPIPKRCARQVAILLVMVGAAGFASAQGVTLNFDVTVSRVDTIRTEDGERAERLVEVQEAVAGEIVQYDVQAEHVGDVIYPAGRIVVSLPIAEGLAYQPGTTTSTWPEVATEFSVDGATYYAIDDFPFTPETTAEDDAPQSTDTAEDATGETTEDAAETNGEDQAANATTVIEAGDVRYVRWTVLTPFEPEDTATFTFRVEVQ
jgi:hypothetical protein